MANPVELIEIAFATTPDDPSPTWVDVTQWAQTNPGIAIPRGRQNEHGQISPSTCTLRLDNADGRFTPEKTSSPYYPNVKKGRRLRVSVTHNSVTYRRFTGYIDEWIVDWPTAKTNQSFVDITASSRTARLGRGSELRSIISEEILYDNPRAHYTFGEAEGATLAGNSSDTTRAPMSARLLGAPGSGGIFFGTATGPPTDDLTAAQFDRLDGANGFYMQADYGDAPIVTSADTVIALECFFSITATGTAHGLMELHAVSNSENSRLYVSGMDNKLTAEGDDSAGLNNYLLQSVGALSANQTYHAVVTESISGGTLTARLYLDGVEQDNDAVSRSAYNNRVRLRAGYAASGDLLDGVMAHVTVYAGTSLPSASRIDVHSDAGSTGFSGERSDERIDRLARLAGVPDSEVSTQTGMTTSVTNQITNGRTALDLMQEVADTENGVLFDARDGVLTFHARSHRYNAVSVLTLGTKEIQSSLEPKLDDEGLVNDVTASRAGGPVTRVVDTDSVTEHGVYHETVELLTTSDNEVIDAANWKLVRHADPQVRIPVAVVDLRRSTTAQATAILAREIGDRITLSSLPSQAPAASMDFYIEGYTERITDTSYQLTFNLSPADLLAVWQLDSSTYSVLGTTTRLGY